MKDRWELVAWDMIKYERFSQEIRAPDFLNYLDEFGKQITVEVISKFIEIDPSSAEIIITPGIHEYFKRNKEELKRRKTQRE